MAHRYFVQEIQGDTARIAGGDAAHLARVLRAKPGDELVLCDGAGRDYTAEITAVAGDEVVLRVLEQHPSSAEPALWAEVFLGYSKGERLEWAIQKSVELGASVIVPFFSRNCVAKPKKEEEKNRRYNRIAQEAAKQSGRGRVPHVEMPLAFDAMLARAVQNEVAMLFYERGGTPLKEALGGAKRVGVITGAEGGFASDEALQAEAAGCVRVGLGPRILRCETAPVAALSALMLLSGDLE